MTTSALVVYRRSECPGGPAAAFGTIAPVFRLVILIRLAVGLVAASVTWVALREGR